MLPIKDFISAKLIFIYLFIKVQTNGKYVHFWILFYCIKTSSFGLLSMWQSDLIFAETLIGFLDVGKASSLHDDYCTASLLVSASW